MERPTDPDTINELCQAYIAAETAKDALTATLKDIRDKLVTLSDGRELLITPSYNIEIKRSEAWSWDQDILKTISPAIPEIKTSYRVDKEVFATLPPAVQSQLMTALETKLGRTTIKINQPE